MKHSLQIYKGYEIELCYNFYWIRGTSHYYRTIKAAKSFINRHPITTNEKTISI